MFLKSIRLVTLMTLLFVSFACNSKNDESAKTSGDNNGKISKEELKQFAEINQNLMEQRQKMQGKMQTIIQDQGLTMEKFQQLAKTMQSANQEQIKKQDPKEMEKFQGVVEKMKNMQQSTQQESEGIITAGGLDLDTYKSIAEKLRSDEGLRERYKEVAQ